MKYKGSFNNATTYPTGTIYKDDVYLMLNNSTIGDKTVTANSYLMALVNNPGTTNSNWTLITNSYVAEDISNRNIANGYAGLDSNNAHIIKASNDKSILLTNTSTLTSDRILNLTIPDSTTSLTLAGNATISNINTGDETLSSITTKVGNASTTLPGLLTSTDWNTFNDKVSTTRTINTKALSSNITLIPSDLGAEASSNKNIANGYAGLDASSKLLVAQMPITGLAYKGTWNASTNSPTLPGSPVTGDYYKVTVAGTTSISSINTWRVNDWIIYNGTSWDRVVNSESVTSVNSKIGNVVITASDVGLGNVNNTAISNLDSLTDVVISGPTTSQVLQYNGSNWVNSVLPVSSSTLDGLTDVVISAPIANNMLLYNGSNWVNSNFSRATFALGGSLTGTSTYLNIGNMGPSLAHLGFIKVNDNTLGFISNRFAKKLGVQYSANCSGSNSMNLITDIIVNDIVVATGTVYHPPYTYVSPFAMLESYKVGLDTTNRGWQSAPDITNRIQIRITGQTSLWDGTCQIILTDW